MNADQIPDAAIAAAVEANDSFYDNDDDLKFSWQDKSDVRELARRMLAAAAPSIAAAEREACARLADERGAQVIVWHGDGCADDAEPHWDQLSFADMIRASR